MRAILIIFLVVIASGCLKGQLSPSEAQQCLLSTSVEPSLLPKCGQTYECEAKLADAFPSRSFQNIPIGAESIRARKGIAGTWSKIQAAAKTIKQIHDSCTTMQAADIISLTITSASELQNALKASEESQEFTYRALEKSIEYGTTLELENIKDTGAFEKFAKLLQMGHELQTQNTASEWGQMQEANQNYFEKIAETIAQNKAGSYGVEWASVFGAYRTGVSMISPDRARIITAVSPLWQGALSAVLGKSKSTNAMKIVSEIYANEIVEHVEQVVAPDNGIVVQVWKNILAFDKEIDALNDYELKIEKEITTKLEDARRAGKNNEKLNQKWGELSKSVGSWVRARGEAIPNGEYWNVSAELIELSGDAESLSWARVQQTKSAGKRIAEWRELSRKTGDLVQKINENDALNEEWRGKCEQLLLENEIAANNTVQNADDCQNGVDVLKLKTIQKMDVAKQAAENELNICVSELNEIERALEKEETASEWYTSNFDETGAEACESARMNLLNVYEGRPLTLEWNEKWRKLEREWEAVQYAISVLPEWNEKMTARQTAASAQKWLAEKKGPFTSNTLRTKINGIENIIAGLEESIDVAIREAADRIKWSIIKPAVVHANTNGNAALEGNIFAYWGKAIEHPFVVGLSNPGIQTITGVTEPIQGDLGEDEIILDGDILPEKGIIIKGEGIGSFAQVETMNYEATIAGKRARVIQKDIVTTAFAPMHVQWKWNPPAGIVWSSAIISAGGKQIETGEENENKIIEITAIKEKTEITYEYEVDNAIVVESMMKNQTSGWGRVYTEYEITAQNTLAAKINATIFTGASGDPLLTETIFITNENGEKLNYQLDAVGTILLSNQKLEKNETKKYTIVIEMIEGIEEWESVMARLSLELEQMEHSRDEMIANEAGKLKIKLLELHREQNTAAIAQKMISIQMGASALALRQEAYEKEWAALEAEWTDILQKNTQNNSKWTVQGNTALLNRSKAKLLEAIQKIVSENTPAIGEIKPDASEQQKIMGEVKEIVARTQKNVEAYEKAMNAGCEKLLLINFVCPITEDTIRNDKKIISNDKKMTEKLEEKWKKLTAEKRLEEWVDVHGEWARINEEVNEINEKMEKALRVLRNAAAERVNKLKQETRGNNNEEIMAAVEKATSMVDSGEFGKSIFIAQSMLNYLNGNKITGLAAIPLLAWPFVGIIVLVGGWIGWREWKKKNAQVIPIQTIPRGNTNSDPAKKIAASVRRPMLKESPPEGRGAGGIRTQVQPTTPARIEEENSRSTLNPRTRPQKGERR